MTDYDALETELHSCSMQPPHEYHRVFYRALAAIRDLRAERDALREYARHSEGCSAVFGDQYRCRCGFRDIAEGTAQQDHAALRAERDALHKQLAEARELLEYQPDFDHDGEQKMDEWNARRDAFLAAQEKP